MSDFLGRLTARHAESSAPAIVPRATSRFEAPALPVDREVVAAVVPDTAPAVSRTADAQRVPPERRAARLEQIVNQVESLVKTAPAASQSRADSGRPQAITASQIVPRVVPPEEQRVPAFTRRAIAAEPHSVREPTVIRVHIGRIDVRAAVPTPDRPRLRSRSASDDSKPMSLDHYLSGKDRA